LTEQLKQKWILEHTLTEKQVKELIARKAARAEKSQKELKELARKVPTV
jgi:hypothetical protein